MSRNANARNNPVRPAANNRPVVPAAPRAPRQPAPSKIQAANTKLNASDAAGAHNRSMHAGMSGAGLTARNKPTATTYLTKHDQNKAAASMMNSKAFTTANNAASRGPRNNNKAFTGGIDNKAIGARTATIARVAQKQADGTTKVFNAKVTQNTMVVKKGAAGNRVQTTYPSGFTPLPKPAAGPSLKPTTKANVNSIAGGAAGLRKVPAPAARPLDLGNQKRFKGMTKNAK